MRKERHVKAGFVPAEDVARYRAGQGKLRDQLAHAKERHEAPSSPSPIGSASIHVPSASGIKVKSPSDFVPKDKPMYPRFEKKHNKNNSSTSGMPADIVSKMTIAESTPAVPAIPTTTVAPATPTASQAISTFSSGTAKSRWATAPADPPVPKSPRQPSPARSATSARSSTSTHVQVIRTQPSVHHKNSEHEGSDERLTLQPSKSTPSGTSALLDRMGPIPVQTDGDAASVDTIPIDKLSLDQADTPTANGSRRGERGSRRGGRARGANAGSDGQLRSDRASHPTRSQAPSSHKAPALTSAVRDSPGPTVVQREYSPSLELPDLSSAGDWWEEDTPDDLPPRRRTSVGNVLSRRQSELTGQTTSGEADVGGAIAALQNLELVTEGYSTQEASRYASPVRAGSDENVTAQKTAALPPQPIENLLQQSLSDIQSQVYTISNDLRVLRFSSSHLSKTDQARVQALQAEMNQLRQAVGSVYQEIEEAWADATAATTDDEL